jgi:hypothetical protein
VVQPDPGDPSAECTLQDTVSCLAINCLFGTDSLCLSFPGLLLNL